MIILDTNVLSETFKPIPSPNVLGWLAAHEQSGVFLTSITLAEMFEGLELMPHGKRRTYLAETIEETLTADYTGRILPFDDPAARLFAKIVAERKALGLPVSEFDAMIAAIARAHRFTVATRNVADFEHCGIRVVNPWRSK